MNYAIVEPQSNRAVAIVDAPLMEWFKQNFSVYNIVEVGSVGSTTFSTNEGSISTISIQPVGTHFTKDAFHMITRFPETISLGEAYKLIENV